MLKKSTVAAALLCLPMGAALADDDIGCGWGTMVWEGQEGLVPKVLGATTNGTSGNQTFGITTGTAGCSSDGVITADARTSMFASANLDQLAAEIAAGEGETLDALAALYEIDTADRDAFATLAQREYGQMFAEADSTVEHVLSHLETAMADDATLARYV